MDESLAISDTVINKMVSPEEMLTVLPLKGRTGEGID